MTRELKLKRNMMYVQLYYFFRSFIFAYVIERLFWRSRGISIAETVYIEIIYAVVVFSMEIPTGVLADRFSRKYIIISGSILTLIGAIGMLFAHGFIVFACIIALSGISGALTSGSVSALIYDSLKEVGETLSFEKYLARIKAIRYGSGLIAALVGSFVASRYNLLMPYQMSVISCVMMVIFNLLLTEPRKGAVEKHMSVKEIINVTRSVIINQTFLKYVIVSGAVIGASIIYIEEFWQNYCDGIHINIVYFGIISGLMSMVVLISSKRTTVYVQYLRNNIKRKKRFYHVLTLISGVSFISLFIIRHPIGIIMMLIAIYIEALFDTLILGDIHHSVESEYRATAESVYAMISSSFSVAFGLIFAYGSEKMGVYGGFLLIGVVLVVSTIIKGIYFKRKELIS